MLYACDAKWWEVYDSPSDRGLSWRDFGGIKVSAKANYPEVHRLPYEKQVPGLSLNPELLHTGGNGGYQALNLAVLMGAAKIILLGYDMQGDHWHGKHLGRMHNPEAHQFIEWCQNFQTTLPDLKRAGVEVINASRRTALTCFPCANLDDIVETI